MNNSGETDFAKSADINHAALLRGLMQRRIGRRGLLTAAGAGAATMGLAACGVKGTATPKASLAPDAVSKFWTGKTGKGHVNFANWPLYMDPKHPELKKFTAETKITVTYTEPINDIPGFYAKIQPQLKAHKSIGYDIIVITNGVEFRDMINNGYFAPLDHSKMPNFNANGGARFKQEAFDPGNQYSMPWASGITGIGYNPKYVTTTPTSLQALVNPAYKGKVGMFSDTEEIGVFAMLAVGANPEKSTPADWQKAADWLKKQQNDGLVRKYYDQDYIAALENGDIWISQAWSGDIFQSNVSDGSNLKFAIPSEGGTLWTDNMTIPYTANNPVDALKLMDFFYQPAIAASLAEYINYITPVPGAQAVIQQDADKASGSDKASLAQLATSSLVFPSEADLTRLHYYRTFANEGEHEQYESYFNPIVTS
jgi:spermidine/putrescine transport system substrate-binding protein